MKKREQLLYFLEKKQANDLNMTYVEIANATGYHPKYVLRMKKKFMKQGLSLEHGNIGKKPVSAISSAEEEKIVNLYKRSNVSVRRFVQFYNKRSYSCIYNVLKKHGLIAKKL